jgi:hypothetical protein
MNTQTNTIEIEQAIKYAGVVPHVSDKMEVGAIFSCSWGYDQTNVDFYCVVECTKTMCKILPLSQMEVSNKCGSSMTSDVIAASVIDFSEPVIKRKFYTFMDKLRIKIDSCQYSKIWDGEAKYKSWHA